MVQISKKSMLADAGDSLDHVQNTLRTPTAAKQAGKDAQAAVYTAPVRGKGMCFSDSKKCPVVKLH